METHQLFVKDHLLSDLLKLMDCPIKHRVKI